MENNICCMTEAEYNSLKPRDFFNVATWGKIQASLHHRETLIAEVEALEEQIKGRIVITTQILKTSDEERAEINRLKVKIENLKQK